LDLGQLPGGRRRDLDRHLVGLELDERLIGLHRIARLFQPFADSGLGHGFAERRHADLCCHFGLALFLVAPRRLRLAIS
jgi:hypothetical protein